MISGYITEKNLLPITSLNFGRTHLPGASGTFEIGADNNGMQRKSANTIENG